MPEFLLELADPQDGTRSGEIIEADYMTMDDSLLVFWRKFGTPAKSWQDRHTTNETMRMICVVNKLIVVRCDMLEEVQITDQDITELLRPR